MGLSEADKEWIAAQHDATRKWVQIELGTNDGTPRSDSLLAKLKALLAK